MPKKRLISSSVMGSDRFKLGLEFSQQALYAQLVMAADDEGFVESPRGICLSMKARDEDLAKLAAADFVILFESGVAAIVDWRRMDSTRADRFQATEFVEERARLDVINGRYVMLAQAQAQPLLEDPQVDSAAPICQPNDNQMATNRQPSDNQLAPQTKPIQTNTNQTNPRRSARPQKAARPESLDEVRSYVAEKGYEFDPEQFWAHYEANGWRTNQGVVRDWHACCVTWQKRLEEGFAPLRRGQPKAPSPVVPKGMEAYDHASG